MNAQEQLSRRLERAKQLQDEREKREKEQKKKEPKEEEEEEKVEDKIPSAQKGMCNEDLEEKVEFC